MAKIVNCDNPDCPKEWDQLVDSGDKMIRVCTQCFKAVYISESGEEAKQHEAAGHRAALPE